MTFWFIIKCRKLFERKLCEQLDRMSGIEYYLPLKKELKQWSDRKKWITSPMIPGYIFLKTEEKNLKHLYPFSYFMGVLMEQGIIVSIKEIEIERLRELEKESPEILSHTFEKLEKNQIHTFETGNFKDIFKDVSATVLENDSDHITFVLHTSAFPFRLKIRKKC